MFLLGLAAVALGLIATDIIREAQTPVEAIPYLTAKDTAPAVELTASGGQPTLFDPAAAGIKVVTFAMSGHAAGSDHLDRVARARAAAGGADAAFLLVDASREKPEQTPAADGGADALFPAGLDLYRDASGKAVKAFGVRQVPMTFVIGADGKIALVLGGGRRNETENQTIDEALLSMIASLRTGPPAVEQTAAADGADVQPPSE